MPWFNRDTCQHPAIFVRRVAAAGRSLGTRRREIGTIVSLSRVGESDSPRQVSRITPEKLVDNHHAVSNSTGWSEHELGR